jgi:hypothetical protein
MSNPAALSMRIASVSPPRIVARPVPYDPIFSGAEAVPASSSPNFTVPLNVCPPWNSTWSPTAKSFALTGATVRHAVAGDSPSAASLPPGET